MIIFKQKDRNIYVITNYKVMYSSLLLQDNLIRVKKSRRLLLRAVISWLGGPSVFYLVVRNPLDRLISFYKNKILDSKKTSIEQIRDKAGSWQKSAAIFFPYFHISEEMDMERISDRLKGININELIAVLPEVYMMDGHLIPQYFASRFSVRKFGITIRIPIRFKGIFKLESEQDLKHLASLFDLDLRTKKNSSKGIDCDVELDSDSKRMVNLLYSRDYHTYGYEKLQLDSTDD